MLYLDNIFRPGEEDSHLKQTGLSSNLFFKGLKERISYLIGCSALKVLSRKYWTGDDVLS